MSIFTVLAQAAKETEIKLTPDDLNLGGAPTEVTNNQVGAILGVAYMVAGIVAVIVIIIGGIRYASSNGDSSGVQSAKNTILYAVVGLIVIILAASITNFVIESIAK